MRKNFINGFSISYLLILLLAMALTIFSFFYWQNQQKSKLENSPDQILVQTNNNDATNWKKYTSDQFKISFKYPSILEAEETSTRISFFPLNSIHKAAINGNEVLRIEFGEDHRELSYIKTEYYPLSEEVSIDGKSALKDNNKLFAIIKLDKNKSLEIRSFRDLSSQDFDHILSTLKFF